MLRSGSHSDRFGFSIIELLIAIIIIGILVAVIIPVLMNRAEEARVAAAESDLEHIQGAEERASIDTGYAYRFFVLDDVVGGDGRGIQDPADSIDGVRDEPLNDVIYGGPFVEPRRMFIDTRTGRFLIDYVSLFTRLRRNETAFGWNGAYINFHRLRDADHNDIPEDPWGEEYLLFTPAGVVDQINGTIETVFYYFAVDAGTTVPLFGPFFDRFTVLSMGPNNAPGDGTLNARFGTDDDLMRQF